MAAPLLCPDSDNTWNSHLCPLYCKKSDQNQISGETDGNNYQIITTGVSFTSLLLKKVRVVKNERKYCTTLEICVMPRDLISSGVVYSRSFSLHCPKLPTLFTGREEAIHRFNCMANPWSTSTQHLACVIFFTDVGSYTCQRMGHGVLPERSANDMVRPHCWSRPPSGQNVYPADLPRSKWWWHSMVLPLLALQADLICQCDGVVLYNVHLSSRGGSSGATTWCLFMQFIAWVSSEYVWNDLGAQKT